jgi:hypothetical protein
MALCNTIAEFGSYDGWLLMGNEVWARFARTSMEDVRPVGCQQAMKPTDLARLFDAQLAFRRTAVVSEGWSNLGFGRS